VQGGVALAGENKKMTRNALILMPAKVLEGVLLLATASIYSRVFPPVVNGQYQLVGRVRRERLSASI